MLLGGRIKPLKDPNVKPEGVAEFEETGCVWRRKAAFAEQRIATNS